MHAVHFWGQDRGLPVEEGEEMHWPLDLKNTNLCDREVQKDRDERLNTLHL